jgi:CRP/FNR family transcriptional regulator
MEDNIKLQHLQTHPLFVHLPIEKVRTLSELLKLKTYGKGEIFGYGEGSYHKVCLLIKGKVKIAGNEGGVEQVKDILTAPDIFGDLSLEGALSKDEYAVALTAGTIVGSFSIADLKKILEDHPRMALDYANTVNRKLRKLEDRHSDLVFRDAKHRLIRFIKSWALSDGSRIGNKIILPNYLTHSDIAGVIATSRQSVNVLFNELRDSGLLYYNRKRIELNDTGIWN